MAENKRGGRVLASVFVGSVLPILLSGVLRAFGIYVFVTPNDFAPGGFSGVAVMLEFVTHLNSGWFLLIFNVPLFFLCFFLLGRREAVISTLSMLLTSGLLIVFDYIPVINEMRYETREQALLAAIASGVLLGAALSVTLRSCGTSGGTTILASIINKKFKSLSVSWMTFLFDAVVVVASFFVYNRGMGFTEKLSPVLLALVSLFTTSKVSDVIVQGFKGAFRFEIVTNHTEEIAKEIMEKTHHGVTEMSAVGMYSHTEHKVLVCIVRKRQIAQVQKIIKQYPDTFASFVPISEVYGRFSK